MKERAALVVGLSLLVFLAAACGQAQGIEPAPVEEDDDFMIDQTTTLDTQVVAPGEGTISLDIGLPEGWHVNTDAPPFQATWFVDDAVVRISEEDRDVQIHDPVFPLTVPVSLSTGDAEVSVSVVLYYCDDAVTLCTLDRRTVIAPVEVRDDAAQSDFTIAYTIVPPPLP